MGIFNCYCLENKVKLNSNIVFSFKICLKSSGMLDDDLNQNIMMMMMKMMIWSLKYSGYWGTFELPLVTLPHCSWESLQFTNTKCSLVSQ